MNYFTTDTLCFPAEYPSSLVARQKKFWDPIIQWAEKHYGIKVAIASDFATPAHPKETTDKLSAELATWTPWQLVGALMAFGGCERVSHVFRFAALDEAVRSSKSLLVALALLNRAVSLDFAAEGRVFLLSLSVSFASHGPAVAARIEVLHQIQHWGEVEDSHDVDHHDIRVRLGSALYLYQHSPSK